jgi:hypothetical protein
MKKTSGKVGIAAATVIGTGLLKLYQVWKNFFSHT